MNISQVAAQLYTLRDHCKTEADIAATLGRVSQIGYQAVQASALGPISEERLVQLCREHGLTLCATHESLASLLNTPDQIIERLHKLECKHTALGSPDGVDFSSLESVMDYYQRIDHIAEKFAKAGISLSHHNHQFEFRKIGDKSVWQIIVENTRFLSFEIDVYWAQYGGVSPESIIRLAQNRMPLLHLKDYGINAQNAPYFAEIGRGNLEFPAIIRAAERSGCKWFIVEQDTTPGDPFESLQISFNFIRDHLCA